MSDTYNCTLQPPQYQKIASQLSSSFINLDDFHTGPTCLSGFSSKDFDTRTKWHLFYPSYYYFLTLLQARLKLDDFLVQFPPNLRYLCPVSGFGIDTHNPFSPFFPHSDLWSGSHPLSYNCYMYLFGDLSSSTLRVSSSSNNSPSFLNYRGSYKNAPPHIKNESLTSYPFTPGKYIIWSANTLHLLIRGQTPSLALDFRFVPHEPSYALTFLYDEVY